MLNIVLVFENYANPFKGTIFTTEKQVQIKNLFLFRHESSILLHFNNLVLSTKLIM